MTFSFVQRPLRGIVPAFLIMVCCLVASCAPGSNLPPFPDMPPGPYQLGSGDQVRIITFGQEQLSGKFQVNDAGNMALPLIGAVSARGLTTAELEQSINRKLEEKQVLLHPSVSVEVIDYRPIFVLGEVAKPGKYPYEPGMTVLTAVAIAGGFNYRAQTDHVSILRKIDGRSVEGRAPRGTDVLPGDVITIFERYF
jgi:polysaccharide export outer membrane protein